MPDLKKGFLIKIFDKTGTTLIKTITNIKNAPSLSMEREKGFKDTTLTFAESFDNIPAYLQMSYLVRIYVYSPITPQGLLIYTGYISEIEGVLGTSEQLVASVWGLSALMARAFFKQGSSYDTSFVSTDIADIFKDVIDHFNTVYPGLISYTGSSIDNDRHYNDL